MVSSNTNTVSRAFTSFSPQACVVSLDVGAKYTGVGFFEPHTKLIIPLTTIVLTHFSGRVWFDTLKQALHSHWNHIVLFVIGFHPSTHNNNFVQKYIAQVQKMLSVWTEAKVVLHPETNSTQWAREFLKDQNFGINFINKHENSVAAARILWGYLYTHHQIDALIVNPR